MLLSLGCYHTSKKLAITLIYAVCHPAKQIESLLNSANLNAKSNLEKNKPRYGPNRWFAVEIEPHNLCGIIFVGKNMLL